MLEVQFNRHKPGTPWTYSQLDQRQREIAERARLGGAGSLLISEVAPVITLGRRTNQATDLLWRPEAFAAQGVEIHVTDRGGLATYHGPGQWVVFVVDRLEQLVGDRRGVRKAVDRLLETALQVCRLYDFKAEIREGDETGVWGSQGKLASVGIHIEKGVLLHGVAINGYRVGPSFAGIRPCGLDRPPGYLLAAVEALDQAVAFERLGEQLKSAFFDAFSHA